MVFVTGGSGLLGGYLLRHLLLNGETVKALYRGRYPSLLSPDELGRIEWIRGDLFDTDLLLEICAACDEVYHCAGMVSFNPRKKDEMTRINVEGTQNVVNASLLGGVRKLVHVSSVSALGRKRDGMTVTEEAQWSEENNLSNYGKSKYLGEIEVWRGISEGLNAVIVNPVIILGVGDWDQSSAATFKSAYNEFPWYTEGVSGFVDAADVARAMHMLMKSDITGEKFIISAENRPYRDIFNLMANYYGKRAPHRKVSPFLAALVWRWEALKGMLTGLDPLLTKETAETARMKVYFDNSKLLQALPTFRYSQIERCISESCHEYSRKLNE
jgi:nucleoside-diphosphate-sugar epimerase